MIQMQNPSDTINKSWRPFSTIKICNMKSTQWTKLEKMVKNWSKHVILYQRNVIIEWSSCKTWVTTISNRETVKQYHNKQYEVDPTNQRSENGRKPLFWPFGSFKNAYFVTFEWSSMSDMIAKLLRPFSTIKICNMKSIRWT